MNWKNILSWLLFLLFLISIIIFSDNLYKNQRCKNVEINIETKGEGRFITKTEIINLLNEKGNKPILGTKFNLLNFASIEQKVMANKLVKSCQISRTLGGNLIVKVEQKNPIARLVSMQANADSKMGYYLDEKGGVFPLSANYTKKVVLLSGQYLEGKKNLKAKSDSPIIELIKKVNDDPFWKANITHIIIESDKNTILYPLIGDFNIEYGLANADEFEPKMNKLKLFYKKIYPEKHDLYKQISIKYASQIIGQVKDSTALKSDI